MTARYSAKKLISFRHAGYAYEKSFNGQWMRRCGRDVEFAECSSNRIDDVVAAFGGEV